MMMQMSYLTDSAFQSSTRQSFRESFSGSIGSSSDLMSSTRISQRKRPIEGIAESDLSGSTGSASSSSYDDDDNSSLGQARASEFQRLKTNHRGSRRQKSSVRFDKVMERVTNVLEAPMYRERKIEKKTTDATKQPPTFFCPNCKTRQRAFIDITSAASQFESPLGYFALYFALYLVSVLFVFGLEEGWTPLDCVYFAVITLTTAGLGDFVPSSGEP
jgi:hypothetical protein